MINGSYKLLNTVYKTHNLRDIRDVFKPKMYIILTAILISLVASDACSNKGRVYSSCRLLVKVSSKDSGKKGYELSTRLEIWQTVREDERQSSQDSKVH